MQNKTRSMTWPGPGSYHHNHPFIHRWVKKHTLYTDKHKHTPWSLDYFPEIVLTPWLLFCHLLQSVLSPSYTHTHTRLRKSVRNIPLDHLLRSEGGTGWKKESHDHITTHMNREGVWRGSEGTGRLNDRYRPKPHTLTWGRVW